MEPEGIDVERLAQRMQWCFLGCIVKAYFQGVQVGHASCWGFESDMSDADNKEVEEERIEEARSQALKKLAALKGALCARQPKEPQP